MENPRNTVHVVNKLRDLFKHGDLGIDDVVMDQKKKMKKRYAMIKVRDKFQKVALYRDLS
jgi:hypothetical protein